MTDLVAAIDQGTTSTRCLLFDRAGRVVAHAQREHRQHLPRPGWVEHDPVEILASASAMVREALAAGGFATSDLVALGITNQRETVVVWDRETGAPYANAIVWQDTRTRELCAALGGAEGPDRFRARTGLPLATYFSGPKIAWALEHVPGLRREAERGRALCGTIDSWLVWCLTGGPDGGVHVTDATNASRTMLMDLERLEWDGEILDAMRIPRAMLPRIVASSDAEAYGATHARGPLAGSVAICGAIGDQQAALLGQGCFAPGAAKCTYGTGAFLLVNTGGERVASRAGLLTTLAYRLGSAAPVYALEGSIAIAGALVQWLRDELGLIERSADVEALARSVADNGGVYFVPAFSGLFAPHWRPDARGVVCGLTRFANKGHLARAALEAVAYQTHDVLAAVRADSGLALASLRVDGGMVANELLMQLLADLLAIPIELPAHPETTALGAAYAAGLARGFFPPPAEQRVRPPARTFEPALDEPTRSAQLAGWRKAVERSLGWTDGPARTATMPPP